MRHHVLLSSLYARGIALRQKIRLTRAKMASQFSQEIGAKEYAFIGKNLALSGRGERLQRFIEVHNGTEKFKPETNWISAFGAYADCFETSIPLRLMWWDLPSPGNFGDWLSPYILSKITGRPIHYVDPLSSGRSPYAVGIGSIARFANERATVLGAGIIDSSTVLDPRANYRFVRGPYTAQRLEEFGGKTVDRFGDFGILLRAVYDKKMPIEGGSGAFVRHYADRDIHVRLPSYVEEIPIFAASPTAIETFIDRIRGKSFVITTAMHCMIACHSYGIPCALVRLGKESGIIGDGVKYLDYRLGVGLQKILPQVISADLTGADLFSLCEDVRIRSEYLEAIRDELVRYAEGVK